MSKRKSLVWSMIAMMAMSSLAGCATTEKAEPAKEEPTVETPAKEEPKEEVKEEPAEPEPEEESEEPKMDLQGRVIKIGAWYDISPDLSTPKGEKQAARQKEIEEKYNCKLEFVNTNDISANVDLWTTSTLAGDPIVDFGYVDARSIQTMAQKGILYPLDTLENFDLDSPFWDPLVKQSSTVDGHTYAVDNKIDVKHGIYYNKRMFEEAGLPDLYELQRNGEWTWDKLEEFAKALTIDKDGDGTIDQYGLADTVYNFILQLIYSNDGDIINYDGTTATVALGSENTIEALQMYDKLVNQLKLGYEREEGMGWDWQMKSFGEGKFAILPHEHYASQAFRDMEDDYGWVMFPKGPKASGYKTVMGTINMQAMSAGTKDPEAVALIMQEWNDYLEGEDAESWKEEWYSWFRDAYAVDETMVMQKQPENRVYGSYNKFPGVEAIVEEKLMIPLSNGEITPAAGVEAITPQVEAVINEVLGQK